MSRKNDISDVETRKSFSSVHLMPPILNSFHAGNTTHVVPALPRGPEHPALCSEPVQTLPGKQL